MKNINELNFLTVQLISPEIKLGDVTHNAEIIIELIEANANHANLLVFPELCLTGATCGDMFFYDDLISKINDAIYHIVKISYPTQATIIIGTPMLLNGKLTNCALFISNGKLLGIVPKQLKNRWFSPATTSSIIFNGYDVAVAENIVFSSFCKIGICVGAISIEKFNQLKDAEIIACIDAQPYSFERQNHINELKYLSKIANQAIVYVNSNANESTTDFVFNNPMAIVECGKALINKDIATTNTSTVENSYCAKAPTVQNNSDTVGLATVENNFENSNFSFETKHYSADIDIDIIRGTRKKEFIKNKSAQCDFDGNKCDFGVNFNVNENANKSKIVAFDFAEKNIKSIARYIKNSNFSVQSFYEDPFATKQISNSANPHSNVYSNVYSIIDAQAYSLAKRMKHININSVVLGISGGIDSTLALLVCVRCFEILQYDKKNINAISMPGLGTSFDSIEIAKNLANLLGVTYIEIPINDAVLQHFRAINHPANQQDIVFENAQARQRTLILFDYANKINGIVVGTGDMSEIALGWSTFNGDHISNYNVNCGVPKTVAIAILEFFVRHKFYSISLENQLERILKRPISPELLPIDNSGGMQSTEEIIGPYELHDFFLYYHLSYFLTVEKLLFIAKYTFSGKYSEESIEKYFEIFMDRFVSNQYKRSCSADGASIYEISLSPRTGLFFPSDSRH